MLASFFPRGLPVGLLSEPLTGTGHSSPARFRSAHDSGCQVPTGPLPRLRTRSLIPSRRQSGRRLQCIHQGTKVEEERIPTFPFPRNHKICFDRPAGLKRCEISTTSVLNRTVTARPHLASIQSAVGTHWPEQRTAQHHRRNQNSFLPIRENVRNPFFAIAEEISRTHPARSWESQIPWAVYGRK